MTLRITSTVILDPAKENDTVKLYDQDDGWKRVGDSTRAIVFEHITEVRGEVRYFSSKGETDGSNNDQ